MTDVKTPFEKVVANTTKTINNPDRTMILGIYGSVAKQMNERLLEVTKLLAAEPEGSEASLAATEIHKVRDLISATRDSFGHRLIDDQGLELEENNLNAASMRAAEVLNRDVVRTVLGEGYEDLTQDFRL